MATVRVKGLIGTSWR